MNTGRRGRSLVRWLAVFGLPWIAGFGCASFSADGGFASVQTVARERLNMDVVWARTPAQQQGVSERVTQLLSQPLTVDGAVQIALLNHRGLQAAYAELGIAEAELVRAGSLPNPHFSMLRASKVEPDGRGFKIEQALTLNLFALLTLPQRVAMEQRRFEQVQRSVAQQMVATASQARKSYYQAVAAVQAQAYHRQVREVAETGAELARRMLVAGNFNRLQYAREQSFAADAVLAEGRAQLNAARAREQLTRALGLWGEQTLFVLPERLPDLPDAARDMPDVERMAMAQRLDLMAVRLETEALARNLGLVRTTRFINAFELGPARVLEGRRGETWKTGYEVSFELPLFDWGGARVAQAESLYMRQVNLAAQAAVEARSEVREAYLSYRSVFDMARHMRDEVIPVRKRISDENLLRYNGMFIGVFELLADARSQAAAVAGYIDAQRDFWLAQADLEMALLGKPRLGDYTSTAPAGPASGADH